MIRGAVLGGDVSRSRSPAIHNEALKRLAIDGRYDARSVDARRFRALVRDLATEGYAYVNVTIPHKRAAAAMADRASPLVRTVGAANTLIFSGRGKHRKIVAHNTDGYGLVRALADAGVASLRGRRVLMLGAGGAAAGALAALVAEGAHVTLLARRPGVASALRRRLPLRHRARVTVRAWTGPALAACLPEVHIVVSAVPAAAFATPEAREGLSAMPAGTIVLDMAYGADSPLLEAARRARARGQDGLPMLVHQAARAVELVVGRLPPSGPLLRAARR